MNTRKYINWLMVSFLALTSLTVTSCKDEPDKYEIADGKPTVYYVRSPYLAQKDSLMTGAYMGNTVCLVGDNLRSIVKLFFNDQEAVINSSFVTDHTLLVDVPSELPTEPTDKIYMITKDNETVTFDFSVLIPSPVVSSISNEFASAGETVTIYGDYLLDYDTFPLSITMPGGIEVTDFESISKTAVTFVIPSGADESGYIEVTSKYGTSRSKFYYKDDRCMLFDWDGTRGGMALAHGWRDGSAVKVDDGTGVDGAFIRFHAALAADGWTAPEDDLSFNYWSDSSYPVLSTLPNFAALLGKYALTELVMKFECRIPTENAWMSTALQIIFCKDGTAGNGDYWDASVPRALWQPWLSSGSYDTGGKWVTVSIPFSNFNKTHTGEVSSTSFSEDFLAGLMFYVMGGGSTGEACNLQLDIDNIRIAPIE